ncbi:MAG: hypothetical protein RL226_474, partial [Bacteroidota bacterium]
MKLSEALKESAGRLLFDSAAEGLLIADKHGVILEANHQVEDMFGYQTGELIGMKVEMLIPRELRENHVKERDSYNAAPRKRS